MTVELNIDTDDFDRLEHLFGRLPHEIQSIAFRRAAARTVKVVERTYARFASKHIKVPQKLIIAALSTRMVKGGEIWMKVKSTNIPLQQLGVYVTGYGVHVRGRGRYEGNYFIPPKSSARAAGLVLRRDVDAPRLPSRMMFGPSPAEAVRNNPKVYQELLGQIAEGEFRSVILQQVIYLLGRV